MAGAHKHARRSAISLEGNKAPKRKARRIPKAASAEPTVEVSSPPTPDIVEPLPPTVEPIATLPLTLNPEPVLEPSSEKPTPESPAPSAEPVHSPGAAAHPTPEYLENLTRERLVWGVAVAVSWTVTVVALMRLAGVF